MDKDLPLRVDEADIEVFSMQVDTTVTPIFMLREDAKESRPWVARNGDDPHLNIARESRIANENSVYERTARDDFFGIFSHMKATTLWRLKMGLRVGKKEQNGGF